MSQQASASKIISRYFNIIIDHGDFLEKRSIFKSKLHNEFTFLQHIPAPLTTYFPRVKNYCSHHDYDAYYIEKIPVRDASFYLLESELYETGALPALIKALGGYLQAVPKIKINRLEQQRILERDILQKNLLRLEDLKLMVEFHQVNYVCRQLTGLSLDQYTAAVNSAIAEAFADTNIDYSYFSHGDLCFSNMLFESGNLKLVDPKGAEWFHDNFRLIHYDLAKISQSLLGNYDIINHDHFHIEDGQLKLHITRNPVDARILFEEMLTSFGTNLKLIRLIEASLFLSMLPYHRDNPHRMEAQLINSINIFQAYR
jgi:hypothetical protein